ncbi:hypothetical protein ACFQLX_01615 [Streptomyces polyrhachis]|uniref:DUF8017 domain-containing protein n=1 Tax=Streptomyces polyrhachis TaxID=1282885 RepID=A0ABW2GA50_9ACTN
MWPGQQAGGEQHPPHNPYQQPVPYGQQPPPPGPYGHSGGGQWAPPETPAWPPPPEPPGQRPPKQPMSTRAVIALIAATAVTASAIVVGVIVVHNRGDGGAPVAATSSPTPTPSTAPTASAAPPIDGENPRGEAVRPIIEGWKAVANTKRHNAFDVPASWEVKSSGLTVGFESDDGEVLVAMTGVAAYRDDWCGSASRALAGTKGAVGAKNTLQAARDAASSWVIAGYDEKRKGKLTAPAPTPFSNGHGVRGHIARASVSGVPKAKNKDGCLNSDGKAVAVSFTDKDGAMASFVLISDTGVKDEVPEEVIKQITGSLRLI